MNTPQYHEQAFSYKVVQYAPPFENSLWKQKRYTVADHLLCSKKLNMRTNGQFTTAIMRLCSKRIMWRELVQYVFDHLLLQLESLLKLSVIESGHRIKPIMKNAFSCMGPIILYLHLFLCLRGCTTTALLMVITNVPNAVLIDHHIDHLLDYIRWKRGSESCITLCNKRSTNMNVCQCIVKGH